MKCKPHVSPLWKKPAANGPWYQVESNPVIPVDNRSFTPTAKWTTATAAIARATSVAGEEGGGSLRRWVFRLGSGGCPRAGVGPKDPRAGGTPPPSSQAQPEPGTNNDHRAIYGRDLNQPEGAEQLCHPKQTGDSEHSSRQLSDAADLAGHRAAVAGPRPRARQTRRARRARQLPADSAQRRASSAAARSRMIWSSSAIRSSFARPRGRPTRRARAPTPSETIWPRRPRPRALSSTSQMPKETAARAAAATVILIVGPGRTAGSSSPPNSRRRNDGLGDHGGGRADAGAGDDPAGAERLVEAERRRGRKRPGRSRPAPVAIQGRCRLKKVRVCSR